jgi:hypothetical protein
MLRVRLFELGHSFEYIDSMNLQDMGDVSAYWDGKAKGEGKMRDIAQKNSKKGKGRRGGRRR